MSKPRTSYPDKLLGAFNETIWALSTLNAQKTDKTDYSAHVKEHLEATKKLLLTLLEEREY